MNSNGDEICNIGKSPLPEIVNAERNNYSSSLGSKEHIDASGSIREFCKFAKAQGITIIPLYPTGLLYTDYKSEQHKKYFAKIVKFWLAQDIDFKDSVDQSFLEAKMLFDTTNHLNDQGRNLRTNNIIKILPTYLDNKSN